MIKDIGTSFIAFTLAIIILMPLAIIIKIFMGDKKMLNDVTSVR